RSPHGEGSGIDSREFAREDLVEGDAVRELPEILHEGEAYTQADGTVIALGAQPPERPVLEQIAGDPERIQTRRRIDQDVTIGVAQPIELGQVDDRIRFEDV